MLAIRIDLLTGRYAATAYNDREKAEWPPHPARLFSALVATWAEGQPGTAEGDAELAALQWLEAQPAPVIVASAVDKVGMRNAAVVFVPVNDVGVIKSPDHSKLETAERVLAGAADAATRAKAEKQLAASRRKLASDTAKEIAVPAKFGKHDATNAQQALLDRRTRQPRTFPCAVPEMAAFAFVWNDIEAPHAVVDSLSRLAQRMVRLGHSSSLVHVRVSVAVSVEPVLDDLSGRTVRFIPDDRTGEAMIRWVGVGQVDRLTRAHARHMQVESRVLPATFVRYRQGDHAAEPAPAHTVFDDKWIVFARTAGPRLPITSVPGLSRQFRRALMSAADQPVAEVLSGHRPEGAPSETSHMAVVPLPVVSGPHPDGALLGLALVLPRGVSHEGRRAVMRAVGRLEQAGASARDGVDADDLDGPPIVLQLGETPDLTLARVAWGEHAWTLQPRSWTRPSRRWASATPVALDRNPGDLHHADPRGRAAAFDAARTTIIEAVQRIGLPPPIEVDVVRSCVLPGTAKPRSYGRFPSGSHKPQRVLVHVRLVFAEPVQGPVLIGAGRYQGMGLCLPVDRVGMGPT